MCNLVGDNCSMNSEKITVPMVSIACITYNQEKYIRQCLDGFLMQKTNFAYEIVIHDDASTDRTQAIITEYSEKYPNLFRPILQKENKYKEGKGILARFVFPECKGKYIALCEGDDYWTDPLKLQKQVDFMEYHQEYVMCSHNCDNLDMNGNLINITSANDETYSIDYLIRDDWYFQTLSVLFRKSALDIALLSSAPVVSDSVLFYFLLKRGLGMRFKDSMGVYRWTPGGVWSMIGMNAQRQQEFRVRLAIYQMDSTYEAASFILSLYRKSISRLWLIQNHKFMFASFSIIYRHFGFKILMRLFVYKFILGRSL